MAVTINTSTAGGWGGAGLSANTFTDTQTIAPPAGSLGLVVSNATQTTSKPTLSTAQTWNAGAVTFTGWTGNVTDTASAAASLLLDLQVGGTSKMQVTKAGRVSAGAGYTYGVPQFFDASIATNAGFQVVNSSSVAFYGAGLAMVSFTAAAASGARFCGDYCIGFVNGHALASNPDVRLWRDAAATLAQRDSTTAQKHRIYGTWTDASNGRWLETAVTTAGVASILPTGNGTGAAGNVLHISGLPTANPGPGILWNNAGTPAIGT